MNKPIIAAFDFDGTITDCDSLIPFLLRTVGYCKGCAYLLSLSPTFLLFFLGRASRLQLKERTLARCFKGLSLHFLREKGKEFASGETLKRHLKFSALQRLRWHQQQGHRCVLISANLDVYLEPWANLMGFQDCLTSKLAIDAQGRVTGKLEGGNCRGAEKTRRLEQLLGPRENYLLYAYGDSDGDHELLAYADYPFYRTFKNR